MAIAFPDENIRRIVAALGLERCRSLTLHMAVDDVVTLSAEQYVERDALAQLATELERREYVLVPKAEWEKWKNGA